MATNERHDADHEVPRDDTLDAVAAEELQGATVHDRNEGTVGTVTDVIAAEDGAVETLVVDVAGFLGLARRTVGIGARNVSLRRGDDGAVRIYLTMTDDELRDLPEYGAPAIPPAAGFRT